MKRKTGKTNIVIWCLKYPYRRWQAMRYSEYAMAILDRRCKAFRPMKKNTATLTFLNSPEAVTAVKKQLGLDERQAK
ncbi:MAG: hypothetical protein ABSC51_01285 [Gaiellaceae bacterium]|jgi:hypothetical protein